MTTSPTQDLQRRLAFLATHVVLVFVVDPASLRAMVTGWYRGRFPSHD